MGGKGYKPYTSLTGKKVSGDWEDSDRGAGNKATRRAGGTVKAKSPTYIAHVVNKGKKKVDPKKNPVVEEKKPKNCGCGQDPCVTYGKGDKKKGHNCASKVKHEEYGIGNCIKEMHTLDEYGNVTHYDVMFSNKIIKNVPSSSLEILEGHMHEHYVNEEKNKENFTPHKMIDPSSKKEYMADTYEQHKKYQKMGYVHEEVVSEVAGTVVKQGGKALLKNQLKRKVVRQGIKVAGKTGGRAAQGGISGAARGASTAIQKKEAGKGEKIGKVVGGLAGGIAGGAAGAPIGGVGAIATGVAGGEVGERIGGAIGKKFDKKKPTVKKESFSDWRNDLKIDEAKVDAGKSPEEKEKVRNVRKFGVSHNVAGHGKLRRSLHKMNRGDKKIPGDKSKWMEMESLQLGEEGYDRMRDARLVKYGIGHDGSDRKSTPSKRTPDNKKIKGKTVLQKETEKKYGKGKSALDIVKAKITAKHGKGAIMDEFKPKQVVPKKPVTQNPKDMSKGPRDKAPVDYRVLAQSHEPVGNIFNEFKKMDPIGKEDSDVNNDGKKDKTDKYLLKRRKAITTAIAKKRGRVKEGFSAWRIDLDFNEQVKK